MGWWATSVPVGAKGGILVFFGADGRAGGGFVPSLSLPAPRPPTIRGVLGNSTVLSAVIVLSLHPSISRRTFLNASPIFLPQPFPSTATTRCPGGIFSFPPPVPHLSTTTQPSCRVFAVTRSGAFCGSVRAGDGLGGLLYWDRLFDALWGERGRDVALCFEGV